MTSEKVQVRIARPDEADAIAKVISEAFAEFEPLYTPEAFAYTTVSAEKVRARFDEAGAIWVALKNGKVVGTVSVVPDEGDRLYIRSMAVVPSAQGAGVGRLLLEAAENYAAQNSFRKLFLYTTPYLSGAIRLYERSGFRRSADEGLGDFFGTPGFSMEKNLD